MVVKSIAKTSRICCQDKNVCRKNKFALFLFFSVWGYCLPLLGYITNLFCDKQFDSCLDASKLARLLHFFFLLWSVARLIADMNISFFLAITNMFIYKMHLRFIPKVLCKPRYLLRSRIQMYFSVQLFKKQTVGII